MINKIFRFISSIRLAVPLMLALLVIVAYGTIVESRYNAELAQVQVYSNLWFTGLMALLWINIFASTISRWPFQQKHIGFVTVHAGLLTLLLGGMVTRFWGFNGTLRLIEGEKGSTLVLPDLALKLSPAESKERRLIELPFQIELHKFSKKDYPGTTIAKNFESQIFVPDLNQEQIISMNEPLVYSGYTVYQASYEQLPNGQFASIFSVNKDPGRLLKYGGGLVLSLGIIIFTLMKTQWYNKRWGL